MQKVNSKHVLTDGCYLGYKFHVFDFELFLYGVKVPFRQFRTESMEAAKYFKCSLPWSGNSGLIFNRLYHLLLTSVHIVLEKQTEKDAHDTVLWLPLVTETCKTPSSTKQQPLTRGSQSN